MHPAIPLAPSARSRLGTHAAFMYSRRPIVSHALLSLSFVLLYLVLNQPALRLEVSKLKLRYRDQPLGTVTLSVGVATFPDHGSTADELLKVADQCLYKSKSSGRNRVTAASPRVTPV